jgi:hypothetical protein
MDNEAFRTARNLQDWSAVEPGFYQNSNPAPEVGSFSTVVHDGCATQARFNFATLAGRMLSSVSDSEAWNITREMYLVVGTNDEQS